MARAESGQGLPMLTLSNAEDAYPFYQAVQAVGDPERSAERAAGHEHRGQGCGE